MLYYQRMNVLTKCEKGCMLNSVFKLYGTRKEVFEMKSPTKKQRTILDIRNVRGIRQDDLDYNIQKYLELSEKCKLKDWRCLTSDNGKSEDDRAEELYNNILHEYKKER